jgi:hypothetical protein
MEFAFVPGVEFSDVETPTLIVSGKVEASHLSADRNGANVALPGELVPQSDAIIVGTKYQLKFAPVSADSVCFKVKREFVIMVPCVPRLAAHQSVSLIDMVPGDARNPQRLLKRALFA